MPKCQKLSFQQTKNRNAKRFVEVDRNTISKWEITPTDDMMKAIAEYIRDYPFLESHISILDLGTGSLH